MTKMDINKIIENVEHILLRYCEIWLCAGVEVMVLEKIDFGSLYFIYRETSQIFGLYPILFTFFFKTQ